MVGNPSIRIQKKTEKTQQKNDFQHIQASEAQPNNPLYVYSQNLSTLTFHGSNQSGCATPRCSSKYFHFFVGSRTTTLILSSEWSRTRICEHPHFIQAIRALQKADPPPKHRQFEYPGWIFMVQTSRRVKVMYILISSKVPGMKKYGFLTQKQAMQCPDHIFRRWRRLGDVYPHFHKIWAPSGHWIKR